MDNVFVVKIKPLKWIKKDNGWFEADGITCTYSVHEANNDRSGCEAMHQAIVLGFLEIISE